MRSTVAGERVRENALLGAAVQQPRSIRLATVGEDLCIRVRTRIGPPAPTVSEYADLGTGRITNGALLTATDDGAPLRVQGLHRA
jgi:hypothetical protein